MKVLSTVNKRLVTRSKSHCERLPTSYGKITAVLASHHCFVRSYM